MAGPISSRPYEWRSVPWAQGRVLTRGTEGGLPVLGWGRADRAQLATVRQLRALGLRPGGAEPVALLMFGHRQSHRREVEHARLYAIADAVAKRTATAAQRAAIDKALAARRTCTDCGQEQDHYLPTSMRRCAPCADAAGAWDERAYTADELRARADRPAASQPGFDSSPIPAQRVADPLTRGPVRAPMPEPTFDRTNDGSVDARTPAHSAQRARAVLSQLRARQQIAAHQQRTAGHHRDRRVQLARWHADDQGAVGGDEVREAAR